MINKEQHVFLYNLGLIALMNGIIALVLLIPNCTQNHAVTYTYQRVAHMNKFGIIMAFL